MLIDFVPRLPANAAPGRASARRFPATRRRRPLGLAIVPLLLCLMLAPLGELRAQPAGEAAEEVLRPVIEEQDVPLEALAPLAADGVSGEVFLRKPPGEGPFPAVLLIHGGAPRWPTAQLRDYALHIHASRFLEAGYVVAVMTRRDLDLALAPDAEQPAVLDTIAALDALLALPYVDAGSVVARGTSVGGYLTLELATARQLAAIAVEEPFSFPFVGLRPNASGEAPDLSKIARLAEPILLLRGDQTPNINEFNEKVFIPALRAAGKELEVLTYPGELHSFAFFDSAERTLRPAVSLQAFEDIDAFFRRHLRVPPRPLAEELVQRAPVP